MVQNLDKGDWVTPNPNKSKSIRKATKNENLKDAKSHFPYKVRLVKLGCSVREAQEWLMQNRYRSWKQKGLAADYYYDNWSILYFASLDVLTHFTLSLSK